MSTSAALPTNSPLTRARGNHHRRAAHRATCRRLAAASRRSLMDPDAALDELLGLVELIADLADAGIGEQIDRREILRMTELVQALDSGSPLEAFCPGAGNQRAGKRHESWRPAGHRPVAAPLVEGTRSPSFRASGSGPGPSTVEPFVGRTGTKKAMWSLSITLGRPRNRWSAAMRPEMRSLLERVSQVRSSPAERPS